MNGKFASYVFFLFFSSIIMARSQTIILDLPTLARVTTSVKSAASLNRAALDQLAKDAEKALRISPVSVVTKPMSPASGDKHDYVSMGSYWWPDPAKSDGLPYIRRDGFRNPEAAKFTDRRNLGLLVNNVSTLAIGYHYFRKPEYADHAMLMIRTWFLDPETRMNPNMQYSQSVPGRNDGRGNGILDAKGFAQIIDALFLLKDSSALTPSDKAGLQEWFAEYYIWLRQSRHGNFESKTKNNHGTWYDVQAVSVALYLGKREEARKILEESKTKRIESQINPNGSQPLEIVRTRSWEYSVLNLQALFSLASLADRADVDLWNYTSTDGRGIRRSLDYLIHYLTEEEKWPYPNIDGIRGKNLYPLLLQATNKYHDPRYSSAAKSIADIDQRKNRFILYYGTP